MNATYQNLTRKSKSKTSDLTQIVSSSSDRERRETHSATRIMTSAGQVVAHWDYPLSDEQTEAHDRLAGLITSAGSVARERGLEILENAGDLILPQDLYALCSQLKCAYASLTTERGYVEAAARKWGWGVEVNADQIEFTFKRGGDVLERVTL